MNDGYGLTKDTFINIGFIKRNTTDEVFNIIKDFIVETVDSGKPFPLIIVHNAEDYIRILRSQGYIDAFDDDYLYDCVEVSTEVLKEMLSIENDIINNSFLIHGYYNFRHLLFGRVCENENNTHYFIGVPGMYCNRERYMASMFGFNNFKKSHRSDYSNPYFGYWYQEI